MIAWQFYFELRGRVSSAHGMQVNAGVRCGDRNSVIFPLKQAKKTRAAFAARALCWHYLFSRSVTRQVSSAHVSLTSVFGMGTGGPSHQSAPTIYMLTTLRSITAYQHAHAFKKGGDPYRIRTDVKGVRGLCLNHLTNGPACLYEAEDRLYTWSAFRDSNPGPTD